VHLLELNNETVDGMSLDKIDTIVEALPGFQPDVEENAPRLQEHLVSLKNHEDQHSEA
jgi:hypothetical protein